MFGARGDLDGRRADIHVACGRRGLVVADVDGVAVSEPSVETFPEAADCAVLEDRAGVLEIGRDVDRQPAELDVSDRRCAVLQGASVRCWGAGADGTLGYGNTISIGDDELPSSAGPVELGGPVEHVDAGDYFNCALLGSGAVRCWGHYGAHLANGPFAGNIGDDELPTAVNFVQVF